MAGFSIQSGVGTMPVLLGLLVVAVVLIVRFLSPRIDAQEPPVVYPRLPLVGHMVGMVRGGPNYFKQLGLRISSGIATLPILTGRMYIVSSPDLASQVQRASKSLDFVQLVVEVAPRMVGLSKEGSVILANAESKLKPGERMVNAGLHQILHPYLTATAITDICGIQLQHFTDFLHGIPTAGQNVDLYKMLMREVVEATMISFYGPENPFALHPELVDDFLVWEKDITTFMIGVLPQWTARRQYLALKKVAAAFEEYITAGRFNQAYDLVRMRHQAHVDAGMSLRDRALFEVPMCMAFGINAATTMFWMINSIFSRPDLLAELRKEVLENALDGPNTIVFAKIRDSCPLLWSTWRETMRLVAPMSTSRFVTEDTIISDRYLLKKGNIVQIIGSALHGSKEIWGSDVDAFNPRRFYYTQNGTKTADDGSVLGRKDAQVHSAAYRSFGGGASLCPGRHFAAMEILTLSAALIAGFDITPTAGYKWDPPLDDKRFLIAVTKPEEELLVNFKKRPGMEDVKWVAKY